ncbi:MAG: hypothetical protein K0S12_552 [Bacteroidetes bacterium]|jgi:Tfp pilus assembly protein PilF|nr:hypothetical protein [Bacteroidota bacterium]
MKKIGILSIALLPMLGFSQKTKVQTAWRALNDYEATVKDGKPDLIYLNKAKDAIDAALVHEDTKNQGKTHAYKARISYAYYQNALSQELKKLEPTVTDKNERAMLAYGNTPLTDFELANEELNKIQELDPKFMETIKEGLTKGTSMLGEDDVKFALVAQQIKMESANIAQGKYKAKKYDEAADYFYKTGFLNTMLYKVKDTANFYNACISAAKAKSTSRILDYNKKMIDGKIASPYNYESMYNAHMSKLDTNAAMEVLKKGRTAFPGDLSLMNKETDYYLAKGKQQEALNNLKASIEKDPKNPVFYLIMGQIYDGMANPKEKGTGKELPKPADYETLITSAEAAYQKGIDLNSPNKEYQYNLIFNLGALYNNYGGYYQNRQPATITEMAKVQKENDAKSQEAFKKAIPLLERALTIKPDDRPTMIALRKLYMFTKQDDKAKEMNEKLKK